MNAVLGREGCGRRRTAGTGKVLVVGRWRRVVLASLAGVRRDGRVVAAAAGAGGWPGGGGGDRGRDGGG